MSRTLLDIINKKMKGLNESENVRLAIKAESEDDKEKIVAALKKEGLKCKCEGDDIVVDVPEDDKEKISETINKICPDAKCNEAEDDEEKNEAEDDEVDEEEDEDEKKVNEARRKKNEEDDEVDEEDDEVDEEDDEDEKNEAEDDEVDEEEDEEEVKKEMHEAIRRDIRSIAKTLSLDENALGQVETAFIAAVETRAKAFAHRIADRQLREDRRALRKDIALMNENVNKYLTYAAKKWVEKNKVAIDGKLKTRLAENILGNIKATLVENNINVPKSSTVLENASKKIERLTKELNEARKELIEAEGQISDIKSAIMIDTVAQKNSLTESQRDKLFEMTEESVDHRNMSKKSFYKRVEMLAEMLLNSEEPRVKKAKAPKTEVNDRKRAYLDYLGTTRFE